MVKTYSCYHQELPSLPAFKQQSGKPWSATSTREALFRDFKTCVVCLAQADVLWNAPNYSDRATSE